MDFLGINVVEWLMLGLLAIAVFFKVLALIALWRLTTGFVRSIWPFNRRPRVRKGLRLVSNRKP